MDKETSGYKGWKEVVYHEGKVNGQMVGREGFRNVINGQEFVPEGGWNGSPPYPTGDLTNCRHISDAYRQGWNRIWGGKDA